MEQATREPLPPGQVWGKKWVIYAAMGIQRVSPADWKLEVDGLVSNPLSFTYLDFCRLPMKSYAKSFHCVTKWSIEKPVWEGVPISYLAEHAGVRPEAKWLMFHCHDGYTAPVPLEDALHEDSIVALRLNDKPLSSEQGFPARPFIPNLYGWKSAKWLVRIEFIPAYVDGYWETYGYHARANVHEEERFKGDSGKHQKRRAFGTT